MDHFNSAIPAPAPAATEGNPPSLAGNAPRAVPPVWTASILPPNVSAWISIIMSFLVAASHACAIFTKVIEDRRPVRKTWTRTPAAPVGSTSSSSPSARRGDLRTTGGAGTADVLAGETPPPSTPSLPHPTLSIRMSTLFTVVIAVARAIAIGAITFVHDLDSRLPYSRPPVLGSPAALAALASAPSQRQTPPWTCVFARVLILTAQATTAGMLAFGNSMEHRFPYASARVVIPAALTGNASSCSPPDPGHGRSGVLSSAANVPELSVDVDAIFNTLCIAAGSICIGIRQLKADMEKFFPSSVQSSQIGNAATFTSDPTVPSPSAHTFAADAPAADSHADPTSNLALHSSSTSDSPSSGCDGEDGTMP